MDKFFGGLRYSTLPGNPQFSGWGLGELWGLEFWGYGQVLQAKFIKLGFHVV